MANKPTIDEKKKGGGSWWRWILWWKISPEEIEGQVENYKTLGITKSARGVAFLFCIAISIFSIIYIFVSFQSVNIETLTNIILSIVILILGFLIFKGQRWAIIIAMILWTIEKSSVIYDFSTITPIQANKILMHIVWWCIFMHAFYVALKVENLRRTAKQRVTINSDNIVE